MRWRGPPNATVLVSLAMLLALLFILGACESSRNVEGGASDKGAGGRVKIGLPF